MIITPPLIFNSVLSFIWITYAWETYLSYRQVYYKYVYNSEKFKDLHNIFVIQFMKLPAF